MTFTRFLGIGIATIMYGLCTTVGWAEVKPADPKLVCQQYYSPKIPGDLGSILTNYKSKASYIDGQYFLCFSFQQPLSLTAPLTINLNNTEVVTLIGLQLQANVSTYPTTYWASKTVLSILGSNIIFQDASFTGPGSAVAGSIGVAFSGNNYATINSTITGFETAVQVKGDLFFMSGGNIKDSAKAINVTGTNSTIQNSTLTGSTNIIVGTIGVALSGSGHTMTANTITGFETGIQANCLDVSSGALNDKVNCTIGPKTVTDNVKYGVVVPTTGQGVTITQNEIRTIVDPYGNTTQKIVLQGAANGGLTPPIFSIDPATMTIWKTLTDDKKFATEIGGVLPKSGELDLFEHFCKSQLDYSCKYTDYFRASCSTTQNDKGLWEFKCTGLNIDAAKGQVFTNVTYTPNTSAMTKLIDVKDIPEIITAAVNPGATISGGSLSDPSSAPPAGDGGLVVGGAGETVAMNDGGLGGGGMSPPPDIKIDDASDGGSAAAMTGGAMVLAGDGAPSTGGGASSGCGGQLMPGIPATPGVFLWWLFPITTFWYKRKMK